MSTGKVLPSRKYNKKKLIYIESKEDSLLGFFLELYGDIYQNLRKVNSFNRLF